MSQTNASEQNLPNGIPPQMVDIKQQNRAAQERPQYQFNGIHSSHSSRDPSPLPKITNIPPSQLPPGRANIPLSQLPPSRSPITTLTQKVGQLNIGQQSTPNVSPKISTTSTPNLLLSQQKPASFSPNSAFSPITPSVPRNEPQKLVPVQPQTLDDVPLNNSDSGSNAGQNKINTTQFFSHQNQKNDPDVFSNIQGPTSASQFFPTQQRSSQDAFSNVPINESLGQFSQNNQNSNKQAQLQLSQKPPATFASAPQLFSPSQPSQIIQRPLVTNVTQQSHPAGLHGNNQRAVTQMGGPSVPRQITNLPASDATPKLQQSMSHPKLTNLQVSQPAQFHLRQSSAPIYNSAAPNMPPQAYNTTVPPQSNPLVTSNSNVLPQSYSSSIPQQPTQLATTAPNMPPQSYSGCSIPPQIKTTVSNVPVSTFSGVKPQSSVPNFPLPTTSQKSTSFNNFNGPQQNLKPQQGIYNSGVPLQSYNYNNTGQVVPPVSSSYSSFPPQGTPVSSNYSSLPSQTAPISSNYSSLPTQNQYKTNLHTNRYPAQSKQPMPAQTGMYNPPQQLQMPQQQFQNRQYPQQQMPMSQAYSGQQQGGQYVNQQGQLQQQTGQFTNQQANLRSQQFSSVTDAGFNKFWGRENYDLLQNPHILPPAKLDTPRVFLGQQILDSANCSSEIFRCTMTKIPENNSLLQKSRLPLGVLIHPFKDLNHLPVIQCNVIVRCRACRTYINPFVQFVDSKRWKCNLCYRINELPEEFQYDPVSKTYGDPSRRPEIKSSTIEYIAPAEYMLRPPQPAMYLFLLDISRLAIESGYLHTVCSVLLEELNNLPGDARTHIGFLAYDSSLHFFSLAEGLSQPHEMTVLDIDDVFLPCPDNLLVNLKDRRELVQDLLTQLPTRYVNSYDNNSALGAALQAAFKMLTATGGRITVFQSSLPNVGPGALTTREDPSQRSSTEVTHLNPANDFYKRLALECSGQQIAVDLFVLNSQYVDIATISGISRFSGGCIHHFPLFKASRTLQAEGFERSFKRYLTRKIGFEAVMRIRCTRGLSIHTFHGNFFVRSTDLLSLPNVNPDAGYGMQVAIDESLTDVQTICFQAALLYTSSKGERRIRVHTLCLPVVSNLHDVIHSADQQCIVGLLAKMAVDRSMQSSLSDAREAFINVAIDILSSYKLSLNSGEGNIGLLAPNCLKLLPLFISALLKHTAFRTGSSTRLDDRVKAMIDMKTKPLYLLVQQVYPDLYPVHNLENQEVILNSEEEQVPMPPRLQLTARSLDNRGAFLLDTGEHMVMLVSQNVSQTFLNDGLGVANFNAISDQMYELAVLDNPTNQRLHMFINHLNDEKPFAATLQIVRDNSPNRVVFLEHLIEDRGENSLSYHEFLQHLKTQVK